MLDERPTATELIAAVAGFLEQQAIPQLDAHTAFHAKVAIHVLQIVMREFEHGASAAHDERERLAALLGESAEAGLRDLNTSLCRLIEEGSLGLESSALRDHLLRSALARIAIDNPNYPSITQSMTR